MPRLLYLFGSAAAIGMVGAAGLFALNRAAAPVPSEGAAPAAAPEDLAPVRILFVGDMMFDRFIRTKGEALGYDKILKEVAPFLQSHAAVIGNLEGPVTDFTSTSRNTTAGMPGNMRFTFDPRAVRAAKEAGVTAVSIGNNHIRDFGLEGLVKTRIFLSEAGIRYFGDPDDPSGALRLTFPGFSMALISYNAFLGQKVADAADAVRRADVAADIVVVYAHWGEEYDDEHSKAQEQAAYAFVDAGADLVVGAHPHVVQEWELYKSRRIYYSLGNFVFDQYFSPETQEGRMLTVIVNPQTREMRFEEVPVVMRPDGTTGLTAR